MTQHSMKQQCTTHSETLYAAHMAGQNKFRKAKMSKMKTNSCKKSKSEHL